MGARAKRVGPAPSVGGILLAAVVTGAADPAGAQDKLDPGAEPTYAALSLESGFADDPRIFDLTAGGNIAVVPLDLGIGCTGNVSVAPQVRVNYRAGSAPVFSIYAIAEDDDLTLVVSRPDGSWMCNDDYDGWDPAVVIDNPTSGTYTIWVGTYGGGQARGLLVLSGEDPFFPEAEEPQLDVEGTPSYGTMTLDAAFSDDPRTVLLRAGGPVDVFGLGDSCTGSVTAAPQVRLNYTAGITLPLNLYAMSDDGDLTLVVRRPDGSWLCSDDYEGTDPAILMESPQSGRYDIWVGEYFGETVNATLFISELSPRF